MISDFILPQNIGKLVSGQVPEANNTGYSGAGVFVFDDLVLKIEKISENNDATVEMMRWLEGKIPVPKVICCEKDNEYQYLLMSRTPGMMSCDKYYMERPELLISTLALAMKMLWSVDISGCPRDRNIEVELKEAEYRVENGLVDIERTEPSTFGERGFKDPEDLLNWLKSNKPDYEPVLSHGDFCLPNLFMEGDRFSGFIDLGATGIGDKWRDIALCYRSLKHNAEGFYSGKVYSGINADRLFDELGIKPDFEKIRYYILLDELF
ncbi:MAG: aminoglycoside 3'-phosphotransferase [Saccharofermentans sp.]|nr:aminoglycoside 3'-phosphotransferase [Saccharofermentans sp.]